MENTVSYPHSMKSDVSVMNNLKHCHIPIPHFTVVITGLLHLGLSDLLWRSLYFRVSRRFEYLLLFWWRGMFNEIL